MACKYCLSQRPVDGCLWFLKTERVLIFKGTVPDQTCVGTVASSGGSASCGNTPLEFNILQPTTDLLLCNMDIVGRTIADTNAIFDFAVYESNSNNVVDSYTK